MRYIFVSIFLLFVGIQFCQAQNQARAGIDATISIKGEQVNNTIYLELLGNSVGYSFNYERRLDGNLWGRVGASYFPDVFVEFVAMPLGISYLFGKKAKYFETGVVVAPAYAEVSLFFDSEDKKKEFGVIISPTIGYRYQPEEKDLFFKIAFTPLLTTFEKTLVPSGGLSVGYSF